MLTISTTRIRRTHLTGLAAGLAVAATCAQRYAAALAALEEELVAEVARRGGETGIDHSPHQGCRARDTQWRQIQIVDQGTSEGVPVYLLRAEGWRYYSRRFGARPAAVAYLAGHDDSGPWAARVPGTCETTEAAVEWLTPAPVRRARQRARDKASEAAQATDWYRRAYRRRMDTATPWRRACARVEALCDEAERTAVLRQGDVYAIRTTRQHDGAGLEAAYLAGPTTWSAETIPAIGDHEWHAHARVLIHHDADGRAHAPLRVPFPARFARQTAYRMGRGGRQGAAD